MLYVGCGNCRVIETLICGGRFMPHMPAYVEGAHGSVLPVLRALASGLYLHALSCNAIGILSRRIVSTADDVAWCAQHRCARGSC